MTTAVAIEPPPTGLAEAEARRRPAGRGSPRPPSSRSYASIVRANVFTVFNLMLVGFGVVTLVFGDWRDALFIGILVVDLAAPTAAGLLTVAGGALVSITALALAGFTPSGERASAT